MVEAIRRRRLSYCWLHNQDEAQEDSCKAARVVEGRSHTSRPRSIDREIIDRHSERKLFKHNNNPPSYPGSNVVVEVK